MVNSAIVAMHARRIIYTLDELFPICLIGTLAAMSDDAALEPPMRRPHIHMHRKPAPITQPTDPSVSHHVNAAGFTQRPRGALNHLPAYRLDVEPMQTRGSASP